MGDAKRLDQAYFNEVYMDVKSVDLIDPGRRGKYVGMIYRPFKVDKFDRIKRFILRWLILSFNFFGSFYVTCVSIGDFFYSLFCRYDDGLVRGVVAFYSGDRSKDLMSYNIEGCESFVSIKPTSCKVQNIFHLVRFKVKVYCLARSVVYGLRVHVKFFGTSNRAVIVNAIDCYRLFIFTEVLKGLDRRNIDVAMTNHYDRWAFLASKILSKSDLNIVQHGFLNTTYILPHQCDRVGLLYAADETFVLEFKGFFSSVERSRIFKSPIVFDDRLAFDRPVVLVISSAQTIGDELECIAKIVKYASTLSVAIVYKVHPLYIYPSIMIDNLYVVDDANVYPKADAVICEQSFLGFEYQSHGVPCYDLIDFDVAINRAARV